MPIIHKCLQSDSEINNLSAFSNTEVVYSTKTDTFKIFSIYNCEVVFNLLDNNIDYISDISAFSPSRELLAVSRGSYIDVIHLPTKKPVNKIYLAGEEVDILSFDLSSTYIIAATKSARVLQYRYNGSSLLSRLCSFYNESNKPSPAQSRIGALSLHNNILACGGEDGKIFLLNLYSQANKQLIKHGNNKITSLCFVDENILISGNINGNIYIENFKNKKSSKIINTLFNKIDQIILMPNKEYVLAVGDKSSVILIDIVNNKIANNNYIKFDALVSKIVLLDNETLCAALQNKKIVTVELPSTTRLKSLILHNSINEAFELAEREPSLKSSQEYINLQNRYKNSFTKAIKAMTEQNRPLMLQLIEAYTDVVSKKDEIRLLFRAYESYPRFQILFFKKKHSLLYAMSSKYPALQRTQEYIKSEKEWKESFKNAQRHMLRGRYDYAKASLNRYMTVISKRPIITLILQQNMLFMEFLKAIEEKEYQKVMHIAQQNDIFTQIPTYISINDELQKKLLKIHRHIEKGRVEKAKEKLQKLDGISVLKEQTDQFGLMCDSIVELQNAYTDNDFLLCYELLDTHKVLSDIELGVLLERHWSKLMHECEKHALKGDIKSIKKSLGELIGIKTRRNKIGDLLRLSFHSKIEMLINKKSFNSAESIIYSYIDIFGIDTEIKTIMKKFEKLSNVKLALTQDQNIKSHRDKWSESKIIMG